MLHRSDFVCNRSYFLRVILQPIFSQHAAMRSTLPLALKLCFAPVLNDIMFFVYRAVRIDPQPRRESTSPRALSKILALHDEFEGQENAPVGRSRGATSSIAQRYRTSRTCSGEQPKNVARKTTLCYSARRSRAARFASAVAITSGSVPRLGSHSRTTPSRRAPRSPPPPAPSRRRPASIGASRANGPHPRPRRRAPSIRPRQLTVRPLLPSPLSHVRSARAFAGAVRRPSGADDTSRRRRRKTQTPARVGCAVRGPAREKPPLGLECAGTNYGRESSVEARHSDRESRLEDVQVEVIPVVPVPVPVVRPNPTLATSPRSAKMSVARKYVGSSATTTSPRRVSAARARSERRW